MDKLFFYEGTIYDDESDFFLAVKRYGESRLSWMSAQREIDKLTHEMLMNVFMGSQENGGLPLVEMNNSQFKSLLGQVLINFVNEFRAEEERIKNARKT